MSAHYACLDDIPMFINHRLDTHDAPNVPPLASGAYAEFAVAKESELALKPKSIDDVHAAAIPVAALTAWLALFNVAGLAPGQITFC